MLLRTKWSLDDLQLLHYTDHTGHTFCRLSNGYKHQGLDWGVTEESIGSGQGCSWLRVSMETRHVGFGSIIGKIIISISTCVSNTISIAKMQQLWHLRQCIFVSERFWGTSTPSELKQTVTMEAVYFSETLLHTHLFDIIHVTVIHITIWILKLLIINKEWTFQVGRTKLQMRVEVQVWSLFFLFSKL
jgi:hypothetical protein